jgi:hypothetical protein
MRRVATVVLVACALVITGEQTTVFVQHQQARAAERKPPHWFRSY